MAYLQSHLLIAVVTAFGVIAAAIAWLVFNFYRRWTGVFGRNAKTPDDVLQNVLQRTIRAEERLDAIEPRLETLEDIGKIAVQKVGFLRFNPFAHTGGDQSFAVALLDRDGNGVVLSSLYTREGVRVYAKEIRSGASKHPLSDEERDVVRQAMKSES